MTGLEIVKQAYGLLGDKKRLAKAGGCERGLAAVNQVYSELWHREHRSRFQPLDTLRDTLLLTSHFLPAMAYGTAMLLSVDGDADVHARFVTLYRRAACHTGGAVLERRNRL